MPRRQLTFPLTGTGSDVTRPHTAGQTAVTSPLPSTVVVAAVVVVVVVVVVAAVGQKGNQAGEGNASS